MKDKRKYTSDEDSEKINELVKKLVEVANSAEQAPHAMIALAFVMVSVGRSNDYSDPEIVLGVVETARGYTGPQMDLIREGERDKPEKQLN